MERGLRAAGSLALGGPIVRGDGAGVVVDAPGAAGDREAHGPGWRLKRDLGHGKLGLEQGAVADAVLDLLTGLVGAELGARRLGATGARNRQRDAGRAANAG